jgi:hypothetical protein
VLIRLLVLLRLPLLLRLLVLIGLLVLVRLLSIRTAILTAMLFPMLMQRGTEIVFEPSISLSFPFPCFDPADVYVILFSFRLGDSRFLAAC